MTEAADDEATALIRAVVRGQLDEIEALLNAGAQIDVSCVGGRTACHAAVVNGDAGILAALLARRPNLALREYGQTALDFALVSRHPQLIAMLIAAGAPIDGHVRRRLCEVAVLSSAIVQALMDRGVVLRELFDEQQRTPLHWAGVGVCDLAALDMLVNVCKIDVNQRDSYGCTCLHIAAHRGEHEQLRWLVGAGADIEAENNDRRTPMHYACSSGKIQSVQLLVAFGADVNARDARGGMPVSVAARTATRQVLHCLLAAGGNFDIPDQTGRTASAILAYNLIFFHEDQADIDAARKSIARLRVDMVRHRALQVCVGLQSRELDALQICEILLRACGPVAPLVPFHTWWQIATTVKHFK